jgi:uncharacterized protein (DUF924 family)
VLACWFSFEKPGRKDDGRVREALGALCEQALRGALDAWADPPRARLALVILLDQVPRHLFRGQPGAYAGDARAQALTARFLERGDGSGFAPLERYYAAVPWLHAEDLAKQERIHPILRALAAENRSLRWAAGLADLYLETIRRFGRFPHRNAILGRESSAEERGFLETEWPARRRALHGRGRE